MALDTEPAGAGLETLDLLETRLRRLEFVVTGRTRLSSQPSPAKHEQTVRQRMHSLERGLQDLAANSTVLSELLQLQSRHHPTLFPTSADQEAESSLQPSSAAARTIVLATAPSFQETVSQLRFLSDLDLPHDHASTSVSLVKLQPRLARAAQLQHEQDREIHELRNKSAAILKRWYEVGIWGQGECWVDWEERLRDVEKGVRQTEHARERQEIV